MRPPRQSAALAARTFNRYRAAPPAEKRRSWWLVPPAQFAEAAKAEAERLALEVRTGRAVVPAPMTWE